MCTCITERLAAWGSAKGGDRWFRLSDATVYFDHPQDAPLEHSLNIDFLDLKEGPSRVAVELEPQTAMELAKRIVAVLAALPDGMSEQTDSARQVLAAWADGA